MYNPSSWTAGSKWSSIFSFLFSTVCAPVCISTNSALGFPFLHILANNFVDLFMVAILTGVRCYLIVVLVCISLMISNVEHVFICLLAIYISFLEKCFSCPLPIFLSDCLFFIIELYEFLIHFRYQPRWDILFVNIISFSRFIFVSLKVSLTVQKPFSLIKSHLFTFCFCFSCSRWCIQKDITQTDVKSFTSYVLF